MTIFIFILKDTILYDKQIAIMEKTLKNKGLSDKDANTQARKTISDVQCTYSVTTNSSEADFRSIISDVVGNRRYRTKIN